MARSPVVCVNPNGSTFRVSRKEAAEILARGLGEQDNPKRIYMKPPLAKHKESRSGVISEHNIVSAYVYGSRYAQQRIEKIGSENNNE